MANIAPQTMASKIIEALNEMGVKEERNKFALFRYKRDVEKLKGSGQLTEAFIIEGMIACLEDDEKKMRSSHENALRYSHNSLASIRNYAVSLAKMGFTEEAYNYFVDAHKIDPANKSTLCDIIRILHDFVLCDGKYQSDFDYYSERWKNLTGEEVPTYYDVKNTTEALDACDAIIDEAPKLASEVDNETWKLACSLIDGVELDK